MNNTSGLLYTHLIANLQERLLGSYNVDIAFTFRVNIFITVINITAQTYTTHRNSQHLNSVY